LQLPHFVYRELLKTVQKLPQSTNTKQKVCAIV